MNGVIIFTLHRVLLGWLNKGGLRLVGHVAQKGEMAFDTKF